MNIHAHILCRLKFLFLWEQCLGVGFLDSMVSVRLVLFFFNCQTVSQSGYTIFTCPLSLLKDLFFFCIFASITKNFSGSNRCVVIFYCSFNLPITDNNVNCLFTSVCHPYNLLMKCISVAFACFLIRLFISSLVWKVFFSLHIKDPKYYHIGG